MQLTHILVAVELSSVSQCQYIVMSMAAPDRRTGPDFLWGSSLHIFDPPSPTVGHSTSSLQVPTLFSLFKITPDTSLHTWHSLFPNFNCHKVYSDLHIRIILILSTPPTPLFHLHRHVHPGLWPVRTITCSCPRSFQMDSSAVN